MRRVDILSGVTLSILTAYGGINCAPGHEDALKKVSPSPTRVTNTPTSTPESLIIGPKQAPDQRLLQPFFDIYLGIPLRKGGLHEFDKATTIINKSPYEIIMDSRQVANVIQRCGTNQLSRKLNLYFIDEEVRGSIPLEATIIDNDQTIETTINIREIILRNQLRLRSTDVPEDKHILYLQNLAIQELNIRFVHALCDTMVGILAGTDPSQAKSAYENSEQVAADISAQILDKTAPPPLIMKISNSQKNF